MPKQTGLAESLGLRNDWNRAADDVEEGAALSLFPTSQWAADQRVNVELTAG